MRRTIPVVSILMLALAAPAVPAEDALMAAMQDELSRNMKKLQLEELAKPYFISYKVDEIRTWTTSASF